MSKIELLCPAGSKESLIAAVENGADSIYLGGKGFNARANANNFNIDELKEGVKYCHEREVNVYLTVNTLINDKEIPELTSYLAKVYETGIDAVIVQDLAAAEIVKRNFPQMNLHASTQMTVYNLDGVKTLQKLGFKRVVLARELNYDEISYICKNTSIDIEVFIHGALCICYSGQCLMSSFIGGRSGNRGKCAQPCRLPYKLRGNSINGKKEEYLLSPKDLSLIDSLDQLIKSGVKSLKVEGRMKRPEYVALVTKIFRKYIDSPARVRKKDYENLLQIYNRGGFTKGYFAGTKDKALISSERPNHYGLKIGKTLNYDKRRKEALLLLNSQIYKGDVLEFRDGNETVTIKSSLDVNKGKSIMRLNKAIKRDTELFKLVDSKQLKEIKETIDINSKKFPIYGDVVIENNRLKLIIQDNLNNKVIVYSNTLLENAINRSLNKDDITLQLNKLGDTPFYFKELDVFIDDGYYMPLSVINELRRECVDKLLSIRGKTNRKIISINNNNISDKNNIISQINPKLAIQYDSISALGSLPKEQFHILYLNINDIIEHKYKCTKIVNECKIRNISVECIIPPIFKPKDISSNEIIESIRQIGINRLKIGNISQVHTFNKYKDIYISGDIGLNVFNSYTFDFYAQLGLESITLSSELSLEQIKDLSFVENVLCECIVYGKIPLMISEAKLFEENDNNVIVDRKNISFPVKTNKFSPHTVIYNSVPLFYTEGIKELKINGVGIFRLLFIDESEKECSDILKIYNSLFKGQVLDSEIEAVKRRGFTNGHFKRGV